MAAGSSAQREAEVSRRHAIELARAAHEQEQRAVRFERGGHAEEKTGRLLATLTRFGFHTLNDRKWPGTSSANIDHIAVGPSGVFVIDTKHWSGDLRIADGHLYRGDSPCDDELSKVAAQADVVQQELIELGLVPVLVRPVLALHGRQLERQVIGGTWVIGAELLPRVLLRHSKALTRPQVEQVRDFLGAALPPADAQMPALPAPRRQPDVETDVAPDDAPEASEPAALFGEDQLEADALHAAMQKPFADWMVFLHPAQARVVKRDVSGPARITGGAGTGKSVVALHRLAFLSQGRAQRLLYVTFVRTVPLVLQHVFARLSPETAHNVEFKSLHSWAMRFLRERRLPASVDDKRCEAAFALAWHRLDGRDLLRSARYRYWKEEVDTVIRGRDLTNLDEYLALDRVGRGTRIGHQQRRVVWRLAQRYAELLRARGLHDWNDVLRLARDEARRRPPEPAYDVVVLDEAQDMPLLAGQLLVALVADKPNGLLFVGDDQQRVFPGGFRLTECGVDVTGRSTRFTKNYRNTREVLQAASALLMGEYDAVLDDAGAPSATSAARSGDQPLVVTAGSVHEHDAALISSLRDVGVAETASTTAAVLVERRDQVTRILVRLRHASIPAVALDEWDGASRGSVLVGTIKRAKGLEFETVHVAYVEPQLLAPAPADADDVLLEQWQRRRTELYVAMTRARDKLWVGVLDRGIRSARPVQPEAAEVVPASVRSTVHDVMQSVLGERPTGGPGRFHEDGWTYGGVVVAVSCDNCASPMHVCRRPYTSGGRAFRFWALTCPQCLTSQEPDALSPKNIKALNKLA